MFLLNYYYYYYNNNLYLVLYMSNYNSYLGNKKCCSTTGPQGPQGPRGFQGPIGPPGPAGSASGTGLNSGLTGVDSGLGSMLVINPATGKVAYNDILEVSNDETITIGGDLIPSSNYTWNLGSTGLRFDKIYAKEIFAAANTIHIGEAVLKSEGKNLVLPNYIKIGDASNHATLYVEDYKIVLNDIIINDSTLNKATLNNSTLNNAT